MAVEGRTWNLTLRLSFFLGRGVRKYKLPGHVTVPVPHIHTVRYSFRRAGLSVFGCFSQDYGCRVRYFLVFDAVEKVFSIYLNIGIYQYLQLRNAFFLPELPESDYNFLQQHFVSYFFPH